MKKLRELLSNQRDRLWLVAGVAIGIALILTVVSLLGLCSEECEEGHNWRLFGLPFEVTGLLFFGAVALLHGFSRTDEKIDLIERFLIASAIGAELLFIYVQKVRIGIWCPVCLGIAACVVAAFILLTIRSTQLPIKGDAMQTLIRSFSNTAAIFLGFLVAFLGVSKQDAMQAAEATIKEELAFGQKDSPIEVYLFTDWACPACQKLEPNLENISKVVEKESKLFYIDHAVHPETLNFIPYHLSFMLKNKQEYLKLRKMLTSISEKTSSPSEQEIVAGAAALGVKYSELNYADVALAIKYFKALGEKFKIKGTPTLVIINTESKKGKKLAGNEEITEDNIQEAISQLKK